MTLVALLLDDLFQCILDVPMLRVPVDFQRIKNRCATFDPVKNRQDVKFTIFYVLSWRALQKPFYLGPEGD